LSPIALASLEIEVSTDFSVTNLRLAISELDKPWDISLKVSSCEFERLDIEFGDFFDAFAAGFQDR
jgi:hypothetical protein